MTIFFRLTTLARLASQKIPRLLWNAKVSHCVHKDPPLDPILSQMNQVHTIYPIPLRQVLILHDWAIIRNCY
jgi:hypothetical protein